jgi:integrase
VAHLIFQQYDERLQRREAKPNTLKNFRRTATLWTESSLDPLTAEDWQIEEWLAGLTVAPRTKRLHFENLSAAYNYAVHRRLLPIAPTETVRLPREPDKEPRILEQEELRLMIGNAQSYEHLLMLSTFMFTGMRRNEVRFLKWEDISPSSIKVVGKGGKLRHVPLHPALGELIIRETPDVVESPFVFAGRNGAKSESTFFNMLEAVRGKVHCSFHDFRRTVATSLTENGVQEGIIDRIMGWAPRTVGRRYYIRRADDTMQEAILRLYADSPVRIL